VRRFCCGPSHHGFAACTLPEGADARIAAGRDARRVLGLSVAAYPRLRPGGRAALAAAFGALAIEGAALATAMHFRSVQGEKIGQAFPLANFSVGGEAMIQAAASNPGLRAIVSDGAGTRSVREALLYGWRGWLALPEAAVQTAAVAALSGTAPPRSLTRDAPDRAAPTSPRLRRSRRRR